MNRRHLVFCAVTAPLLGAIPRRLVPALDLPLEAAPAVAVETVTVEMVYDAFTVFVTGSFVTVDHVRAMLGPGAELTDSRIGFSAIGELEQRYTFRLDPPRSRGVLFNRSLPIEGRERVVKPCPVCGTTDPRHHREPCGDAPELPG